MNPTFPRSQKALIAAARADRTQAEFAREFRIDRSLLSRYENEKLGAPVEVITRCLEIVSDQLSGTATSGGLASTALFHARAAVTAIERLGEKPPRRGRPKS